MDSPPQPSKLEVMTLELKRKAGRITPSRESAVGCVERSGLQPRVDVGVVEDAEKRADDDEDHQHEEDSVKRRDQPNSAHSPLSFPMHVRHVAYWNCTGFQPFRGGT